MYEGLAIKVLCPRNEGPILGPKAFIIPWYQNIPTTRKLCEMSSHQLGAGNYD
jgi:hypothetical protein